jgi:periplasmic protein TonB
MLRTLLESNAPRQRRRASTAASLVIHTVIIGGAVVATAAAKTHGPSTTVHARDTVIYVAPRPVPRSAAEGPARQVTAVEKLWRVPPARVLRFDATQPPSVGIDLDVQRLLRDRSPGPTEGFDPWGPAGRDTTGPSGNEVATAATVERPAALRVAPRPWYPEPLRAARVTGRVVVRLVVDTVGRVEPASVVIRETSHDLFSEAVRAVLPSLRFIPAEAGGRRVRMLVELPFEFHLTH